MEELIKSELKKIKAVNASLEPYAYCDENWWFIAINDYDFYTTDSDFKKLKSEIRKEIEENGGFVIFVCRPANDKVFNQVKDKNLIKLE